MPNHQREYPIFSACGLNCGLCPRYQTYGIANCTGCAGEGSRHCLACKILACCLDKNLEICYLCAEFPCQKYGGIDTYDSFITHRNQFANLEKAQEVGIDAYLAEQHEKMKHLQFLLAHCNERGQHTRSEERV